MKTMKSWYPSVLIAAALAVAPVGLACATAPAPAKVEASIPFGLIRDWQGDKERGMWIQAYSRKWYYAEFMGRCLGLNFATAVGFDTRYQSSFDRFSSVFVPGYGRCPIATFTPSEGPPRKKRKGEERAAQAEEIQLEEVRVVGAKLAADQAIEEKVIDATAIEDVKVAAEGGS